MADVIEHDLELEGYGLAVRRFLESSERYEVFKSRVTQEIQRLGFCEWSYVPLDIPVAMGASLGSYPGQHYEYDLMYQHAKTSQSHIYQSTVQDFLSSANLECELFACNERLIKERHDQGYWNILGVPITVFDAPAHAAFFLYTKTDTPYEFVNHCEEQKEKLKLLIQSVDEVGYDKHSRPFTQARTDYKKLMHSRAMDVLVTMIEEDCPIVKAADAVGLSRTAADKQLAKLRELLNVRYTHTAVSRLALLGQLTDKQHRRRH